MSRSSFAPLELENLIEVYKNNKDTENQLKKDNGVLNGRIKTIMSDTDLDKFETEHWVATITKTPKEDFNELKAIEILKNKLSKEDLESVVKTQEYIDDDALEKLVYNKKFSVEDLASCRTVLEPVVTLRIGKKK